MYVCYIEPKHEIYTVYIFFIRMMLDYKWNIKLSIVNPIGIVLSLYDTFLDHFVVTAAYMYNKDKYVYSIENMYTIRLGIGMYAISGQNYQC